MVTARMAECLLLMAMVMATVLPAGGASCGSSSIRCSSSSKCIRHSDLCDGSRDCPVRGEDEDAAWCAMYKRYSSSCSAGTTLCGSSYNCQIWVSACQQRCASPSTPSPEVCTAITNDLLPGTIEEPEPDITPQIVLSAIYHLRHFSGGFPRPVQTYNLSYVKDRDIKELVSFMSVANCSLEKTSALTNQTSSCPQLYISIGNTCIAPLPFALTWPEARVACQSIAGKLLEVEFVETFAEIVQFLIKADLTTDYWIGGFYDIENEDWAWSSGSKMPRSTPYWAVKYNSTCVTRQSPTLGALPGCFHYQQAPTSQGAGYCAALQFEYMYYISDEGCFQKKQPLCIH